MDNAFSKNIFGITTILWRSLNNSKGYECIIELTISQRKLIKLEVNSKKPCQKFRLIPDPGVSDPIIGSLEYVDTTDSLLLTLKCQPDINIKNYALCDGNQDVPCAPYEHPICDDNTDNTDPCHDEHGINLCNDYLNTEIYSPNMSDCEYKDLFPYLYMHPWPEITNQQMAIKFVQYNDVMNAIKGKTNLFNVLVIIKNRGSDDARNQIMDTSTLYIEGDEFILHINLLDNIIRIFPCIYNSLHSINNINLEAVVALIIKDLDLPWVEIIQYLSSARYQDQIFLVWQSYFSLVNISGYSNELLNDFTKILVIGHLIDQIRIIKEKKAGICSSEVIKEYINAVILLNRKLYPLPPQGNFIPSIPSSAWIIPYAIGDLQIVQQKLKCYRPGEVSYIENIMAGETKKTTHRQFDVLEDSSSEQSGNNEINNNEINFLNSDLIDEVQKTILSESVSTTFNDLTTSYGTSSPSTAKVSGGWTIDGSQSSPKASGPTTTKLAKDITSKTAHRLSRQIAIIRQKNQVNGNEILVEHIHSNSQNDKNRMAIYRWIDKVYSACTFDYGNRLMIELMVEDPAEAYINNTLTLQGIDLTPPPTLESLGVFSYNDVNKNNYAELLTTYKVEDVDQYTPKPGYKVNSIAFQSNEGTYNKEIILDSTYQATHASLTYTKAVNSQNLMGIIGSNAFTVPVSDHTSLYLTSHKNSEWTCTPNYTPSEDIESGTLCFNLNNEVGRLCVSVNPVEVITSPPTPVSYSVTVEVFSEIEEAIYKQWQMNIYSTLVKSYITSKDAYFIRAKSPDITFEHTNPEENRLVERAYLKQAGLHLLINQRTALVGQAYNITSPPGQYIVNAPRYEQFYDHVFEWDEMTYRFYLDIENEAVAESPTNYCVGTDSLFTSFLKSKRARLLVPVKPEHAKQVLYFLATGVIWDANPNLAPALDENKDIISELITLATHGDHHHCKMKESWDFIIPSSMVIIQSSDQLPSFDTNMSSLPQQKKGEN